MATRKSNNTPSTPEIQSAIITPEVTRLPGRPDYPNADFKPGGDAVCRTDGGMHEANLISNRSISKRDGIT